MDPKSPGTDLARGSYSGLSLSEFRLHAGFIHLAQQIILREILDKLPLLDFYNDDLKRNIASLRRPGPIPSPAVERGLDRP
mgnify:CR=1 FL=1